MNRASARCQTGVARPLGLRASITRSASGSVPAEVTKAKSAPSSTSGSVLSYRKSGCESSRSV